MPQNLIDPDSQKAFKDKVEDMITLQNNENMKSQSLQRPETVVGSYEFSQFGFEMNSSN